MKILQLHTNKHGLVSESGYPKGGLEKVIVDVADTLHDFGIDNFVNDTPDSRYVDTCSDQNRVISHSLDQKSYNRYFKKIILTWIESNKPDHIIVHGSNKLLRFLTENGIACLFVDHQMYTSINKLYHDDLFNAVVPQARSIGSLIYTVSAASKNDKEEKINGQGWYMNGTFEFDGWLKFQHSTNELMEYGVSPGNGRMITIGRAAGDKAPHHLIKYSAGTPADIFIMYDPGDDKSLRYRDEKILKKKTPNIEVHENAKRSDILRALNNSSIYYSTSPGESAGITAFEALSMGVPVVLNEKQDRKHASRMFMPEGTPYIRSKDEDIPDLMNMTLEERIRCKEECARHNTPESFIDELIRVLKRIDSYKHRESNSLLSS